MLVDQNGNAIHLGRQVGRSGGEGNVKPCDDSDSYHVRKNIHPSFRGLIGLTLYTARYIGRILDDLISSPPERFTYERALKRT